MGHVTARTSFKLSLIENAFDSLNESLNYVEQSNDDPSRWKFAVLNLTHALELLLKHRLRVENELLVWDNVDRPGKTVSLERAVERLIRLNLGVSSSDRATIEQARIWRNNITHFEVDLVLEDVREIYIQTFEFFYRFFDQQLNDSLTDRVKDEHLQTAADLVQDFTNEFITFRGRNMHRKWPTMLVKAQDCPDLHYDDETPYERIRWGSEDHWHDGSMGGYVPKEYCPDCACAIGEFHGPVCDQEKCPRCRGQLISCDCALDGPIWGVDPHNGGLFELDRETREAAELDPPD